MTWHVLDTVLHAVEQEVAQHAPERGGALLGPAGRPLVTRFLLDPDAQTTGCSYSPSAQLNARVRELERAEDLEFKGILHSHPPGLDRPSPQDERELAVGLRRNPHLGWYLLPIVTAVDEDSTLAPHELRAGAGKVSFFGGWRSRSGKARAHRVPVQEVPLHRDLARLAAELGGGAPEVLLVDWEGRPQAPAGRLVLEGGLELLLLASEYYPAVPPILLATLPGELTEQLDLSWQVAWPAATRLLEAVRPLVVGRGPYRRAYGPRGSPALTVDPAQARTAGWAVRFTSEDPEQAAARVESALFERSAGLLTEVMTERHVVVAGAGSVGSYVAEHLVRAGVGALTLVDPETVDAANLSRTSYEAQDVGRAKVEALARRLWNINPRVKLTLRPVPVQRLERADLDAAVSSAHLVVGATDSPEAQRLLNHFAYVRGCPAVFVGLYAGAQGGEVILSVPGRCPCYLCATGVRHGLEQQQGAVAPEADYGTARLPGEMALAADIQHVGSAAVKLALSLLVPPESPARLREFAERALEEEQTYLTLSTVPSYWFYPHLFAGTPGQGAYQAVWLTPVRRPDCPVCGTEESRTDPAAVPLQAPRLAAFRGLDLAALGLPLPPGQPPGEPR